MPSDSIAAAVLRLQDQAGNRAVLRGLAGGRRVLARYESPEHEDLGDKYAAQLAQWIGTPDGRAWIKRNKLEKDVVGLDRDEYARGIRKIKFRKGLRALSPGEIIALMGDFYETWADFASAEDEEVGEFLTGIALERQGKLENANARYEEITAKHRSDKRQRYLALAQRNAPHFTPGNRKQWRKMHAEALAVARQAGEDEEALEKALFIDAAAGHFLTDAFAAGHLFDHDALTAEITVYLRTHEIKPENREMTAYQGAMDLLGVSPDLVLKNVHDRMNREGFEVSNGRGMRWTTYGDQYLAKAEDTQKIAALAVYVSRRQVFEASAGANPDPAQVESLLPDEASVRAANERASAYVPAAAADEAGLLYRQRDMAKAKFGKLIGAAVKANLEAIGAPERDRQLQQQEETARKTGMPQVPYQFEWRFGSRK